MGRNSRIAAGAGARRARFAVVPGRDARFDDDVVGDATNTGRVADRSRRGLLLRLPVDCASQDDVAVPDRHRDAILGYADGPSERVDGGPGHIAVFAHVCVVHDAARLRRENFSMR